MGRRATDPEVRFWSKVEKTDTCWNWVGTRTTNGYGIFTVTTGNTTAAHRHSFRTANGEIPAGMQVDHICRSRSCVRPDHLRLATPAENMENQGGHRDSRSGYRGVSYHTQTGKWQAKATKNGKTYSAGLHINAEAAAESARQLRLDLMTRNELDKAATK